MKTGSDRKKSIKLSWLGHAMFLIEGSDGIKILTDPYSEKTGYSIPEVNADIVTVSHHHYDHDNVGRIDGSPEVIESAGRFVIGSIIIEGIPSYHDEVKGKKRGENIIFKFILDQLVIAHMGDYGQSITEEQLAMLKDIDILLIPVGGTYTIDSEQAAEIVQRIKSKIVVPMHYKTKDCVIKVDTVEPFLRKMPVIKQKESSVRLSASEIPDETEVWVMDYIQ
ncbi:MAG: MBL fold metallo-hydrolase [Actinobacteria bacterium]|nr:MBL fold metallo-hydrolase [Actinomycetota bacterium]